MNIELVAVLLGALAAVLGLDKLRAWRDRRQAEQRLDRSHEARQEAERRAREAEAAAARAEAERQREREQDAARKELEDDLGKIDSDLPGAVDDALREARERGGAA